ncbi:SMI1/KNR4 family protein [Corynebacterium sp. S7]
MHIEQQHLNPLLQTLRIAFVAVPDAESVTIRLSYGQRNHGFQLWCEDAQGNRLEHSNRLYPLVREPVKALHVALAPKEQVTIAVTLDVDGYWKVASVPGNPKYVVLRDLPINDAPQVLPEPSQERIDELTSLWDSHSQFYRSFGVATDQQLDELSHVLGQPVPPELAALLRLSNGPELISFDNVEEESLTGDWSLSNTEIIERDYTNTADVALYPPYNNVGYTNGLEGATQLRQKHPGWIPFANDYGGNYLAIDTVPGPNGTPGQVITFGDDEYDGPTLIADSLIDYIAGRLTPEIKPPNRKFTVKPEDHFDPASIPFGTQELTIGGQPLVRVSDLAGQSPFSLCLYTSEKIDLNGIADFPLQELRLSDIEDVDLTPLANHPTLRILKLRDLRTVHGTDILAELPALETANLESMDESVEWTIIRALSLNTTLALVDFGQSTKLSVEELNQRALALASGDAPKLLTETGRI